MKKISYILSATILLTLLFTVGCKKDDDPGPTAEELQIEAMTKTWTINTARLGSETITDLTGLTLTVDANQGYTTNSATITRQPNPWPVSGTFVFGENADGTANVNQVIREDGAVISVAVDGTTLTLEFTFDDASHTGSNGRVDAIDGAWFFEFI